MATAVQKIASLSTTRDIPFNKLLLSQSNVRRTKAGVSVEELAEDIARRGLLHNLNVRPVVDGDGQETGMFEVPAGGRRFRALEMLVKGKRLAKTAPVSCNVREAGSAITAEEDSLAENTQPDRLLTELTAHRTLALRDALGANPRVAMTALLHKLVVDSFQHRSGPGCLEASVRHVFFQVQADDLKDSASAKSVTDRHDGWKAEIPADDEELWDRIDGMPAFLDEDDGAAETETGAEPLAVAAE